MAERIRRWTSYLMVALRAGLNPGTGDFFMMMVERRAKRERRRVGMSAANVGARPSMKKI